MQKGIDALKRMYESLDTHSPIKQYIDNNCFYLLLVGNTERVTSMVNPDVLSNHPKAVTLFNRYTVQYTKNLTNTTGVYTFFK